MVIRNTQGQQELKFFIKCKQKERFKMYNKVIIITICLFAGCNMDTNDNNENNLSSNSFALCEGNFNNGNASLWSFSPDLGESEVQIIGGTSLGDVAQSFTIHDSYLYVVVNNSHKIEVLNLNDENFVDGTISMAGASPRYFVTDGEIGYVSCWNLNGILVLNISTRSITDTISIPGKPENLILEGGSLYASIPFASDWSTSKEVVEISTISKQITNTYEVIPGPRDMELHGSNLYVSSSYYDANYVTYTGLSKIDLTDKNVITYLDASGSIAKDDIIKIDEKLYRSTSTGIARIKEDLSLDLDNIIGDKKNVYSVYANDAYLFFGTTGDYIAPDTVYVTDHSGNVINQFVVGAIPGDFISQ